MHNNEITKQHHPSPSFALTHTSLSDSMNKSIIKNQYAGQHLFFSLQIEGRKLFLQTQNLREKWKFFNLEQKPLDLPSFSLKINHFLTKEKKRNAFIFIYSPAVNKTIIIIEHCISFGFPLFLIHYISFLSIWANLIEQSKEENNKKKCLSIV